MFGAARPPRDPVRYTRSIDSRSLQIGEQRGRYVYVVDLQETIHILEDHGHTHPFVLGGASDALYAGEILIDPAGCVTEVNNLSGTFRFDCKDSLCCVAGHLQQLGFTIDRVVWFPPDGSSRAITLACS